MKPITKKYHSKDLNIAYNDGFEKGFNVDILFCAFRYALGRKTYVVIEVVDYMIENWGFIAPYKKEMIQREIKEAITNGSAGMDCDIKSWKRILELK